MQFASRVQLIGDRGIICLIAAEQARRIINAPNVKRISQGKRISALYLLDHNPATDRSEHFPSNSLRAGYMQTLSGGEPISIETLTESRKLTTEPCRSYKLKRIPEALRPLYRMAVLDNLVRARA